MRRNFSPLIGLLVAAIMLAAIPAAFAAAPGGLPFRNSPAPEVDPSPVGQVIPESPPVAQVVHPASEPALPAHLAPQLTPPEIRPVDDKQVDVGVSDLIEPDRPEIPQEIKARCFGSVDDTGAGSVECNWTARESLTVTAWQLWKVAVRPEHGERNLVVELRPETTSFVDRDVEVPGHYLYVVLGLDGSDVIARSAVAPANLVAPPGHDDVLKLRCRPTPGIVDRAAIGCEWSPTTSEAAVGYVMWRSVDDGDRVVITRTGLDEQMLLDTDVSAGHRYTYVITAVDIHGEVVGRSRPEHAGFPVHEPGPRPHPDSSAGRPARAIDHPTNPMDSPASPNTSMGG